MRLSSSWVKKSRFWSIYWMSWDNPWLHCNRSSFLRKDRRRFRWFLRNMIRVGCIFNMRTQVFLKSPKKAISYFLKIQKWTSDRKLSHRAKTPISKLMSTNQTYTKKPILNPWTSISRPIKRKMSLPQASMSIQVLDCSIKRLKLTKITWQKVSWITSRIMQVNWIRSEWKEILRGWAIRNIGKMKVEFRRRSWEKSDRAKLKKDRRSKRMIRELGIIRKRLLTRKKKESKKKKGINLWNIKGRSMKKMFLSILTINQNNLKLFQTLHLPRNQTKWKK